VGCW
jgi:hypothetical protein